MEANPTKFQAIRSNTRKDLPNLEIKVGDTTITSQTSVKSLSVYIDHYLSFTEHIKQLCRRAGQQINVLKLLSKLLNIDSKLAIYKSFIYSNFNYCPVVWHACGAENTERLELLQKRALRFVFSD